MDMEGCILVDRNAAAYLARFYTPLEGMERLDFLKIHAQYWTDPNPLVQREKKAIKCAEIRIPHSIPADYIVGAYVAGRKSSGRLKAYGFDKKIVVNPEVFYK